MFNDIHEAARKQALREMCDYVDSQQWIDDRRAAVIRQLGTRYLMHPANRIQKRAVPYGSVR
jgi:hypothetical protein